MRLPNIKEAMGRNGFLWRWQPYKNDRAHRALNESFDGCCHHATGLALPAVETHGIRPWSVCPRPRSADCHIGFWRNQTVSDADAVRRLVRGTSTSVGGGETITQPHGISELLIFYQEAESLCFLIQHT